MAFFSGLWQRGKAIVARVISGTRAGITRVIDMAKGQPVTRGASTPTSPQGVTEVPKPKAEELLTTGKTVIEDKPVIIEPTLEPQTIAGAIPKAWMDELDWKEPILTGKASIFGEPFHYQIEFNILVKDVDQNGKPFMRTEYQFYTVTSDVELSRAQAIARGLELAEIDYNTDDPYFGGTVIGIGTVQPVVYTA